LRCLYQPPAVGVHYYADGIARVDGSIGLNKFEFLVADFYSPVRGADDSYCHADNYYVRKVVSKQSFFFVIVSS